jgi:hypothetical protein
MPDQAVLILSVLRNLLLNFWRTAPLDELPAAFRSDELELLADHGVAGLVALGTFVEDARGMPSRINFFQ